MIMRDVRTVGISPKVIASTSATLGIGIAIAVLNALQDHPDLIPGPTWLQAVLLAIIPALLTFLVGYRASPGEVETQ